MRARAEKIADRDDREYGRLIREDDQVADASDWIVCFVEDSGADELRQLVPFADDANVGSLRYGGTRRRLFRKA